MQKLDARKESDIKLDQVVCSLEKISRPLNAPYPKLRPVANSCHQSSGPSHEAVRAVVKRADPEGPPEGRQRGETWYIIEKGVPVADDSCTEYRRCYREGTSRIVLPKAEEWSKWMMKPINGIRLDVTLADLLDACGLVDKYNVLEDNCWNAVQRMKACARGDMEQHSWQRKKAVRGAAVVGVTGVIGAFIAARLVDALKKDNAEENAKCEEKDNAEENAQCEKKCTEEGVAK